MGNRLQNDMMVARKRMGRIGALLCFLLLVHPLVGMAAESAPQKVLFLPQWIPQAQFAGYMVALEKGFYREAGLDLTLMQGGPSKPAFEFLRTGKATFCTGWLSTAIQLRAEGVPVVNIGQVIQSSALLLIARKASGIRTIKDLSGRKIGCWEGEFRVRLRALIRKDSLNVAILPMYRTVNLFLKGGVDAMAAMWYNEYHQIIDSGIDPDELTVFFFRDLDLDFPEDGLYCMESTFRADPGMCKRFVDASLKGWLYAFEHEDETLQIVMRRAEAAHTGTNMAHQRWMFERMKDLILSKDHPEALGRLKQKDYDRVAGVLSDLDLIQRVPPFHDLYKGPEAGTGESRAPAHAKARGD